MDWKETAFEKQQMKLVCKDGNCSVFQLKTKTGDGTSTFYQVYPGIYVMYNDYHITCGPARQMECKRAIIIEHCREGRVEWKTEKGTYWYLTSGDIVLDSFGTKNKSCHFPLSHYHGVSVTIFPDEVMETLGELLSFFQIDLDGLEKYFEVDKSPFVIRKGTVLEHFFQELYHVPDNVQIEYFRVKIMELFVLLKSFDKTEIEENKPYFYKTQVEKIKAIMQLMTSNPEVHYTMEELAERFDLSVSALKKCFKGVYGTAIFTYMRNFRMDMAATLLTQTDESVTEIAGKVGYTNTSKFAEAFKCAKGKTPLAYRKQKPMMSSE